MTVAAASIDAVFDSFIFDFCVGDYTWWWPCDVQVPSGQVIADDEEGHLFRVPFTADGDGNVNFGDPVRVVTEYRDIPADQAAVAASRTAPIPVAARAAVRSAREDLAAGRIDKTAFKTRLTRAVRAATTDEGDRMTAIAPTAVLERLGLPEDATEEQILAALDAETTTETEAVTEETTVVEETTTQTVAASASAVTVDREQFEALQRDAKAGAAARAAQLSAERERVVDAAVAAGKFPPSRRDHYIALMSADEAGTKAFIDGLATGVIPTQERGVAATASESSDLGWFPQFTTQKENV